MFLMNSYIIVTHFLGGCERNSTIGSVENLQEVCSKIDYIDAKMKQLDELKTKYADVFESR